MKKWQAALVIFFVVVFLWPLVISAQEATTLVSPKAYVCPPEFDQIYEQKAKGEKCTSDYEEFKKNPSLYHFWTDDQEVTVQGRAKERARQFIYWVMTHSSIDNHPVLIKIWTTARNLSYFFVILTAALLGLGIIIGQRTNFDTGVKVWPSVMKILTAILYISFSATIVITIVQISDVLMKFFIENLGGKDLFNIYFSGISQESNYTFYGIKDLNLGAQESLKTQLYLLKLTEISYYFMGGMLILRKIILWFLLFVSPFLALLLSFAFLKNVGWIWIGVFFQWVFYGPLMALFLGGLASIWKGGIPFIFDFSRSGSAAGYIYPTATNILWGGPAQELTSINNVNYIDPYVEYIITLIMLWAVTVFPWWLLRNMRDYCCDGINAIKNILMSNLGQGRNPGPTPSLSPVNIASNIGAALKIPREVDSSIKTRIETVEEIKKAKTEEIVHSLDIQATKLTDVARLETSKEATQNMNYLKNPTQASTASERQKYMNIRVELSSRAAKADPLAGRLVTSVFAPPFEQVKNRQAIITSLPKMVAVTQVVSVKVKLPTEKVQQISSSVANYVSGNSTIVTELSKKTQVEVGKVQQILSLFHQSSNEPPSAIVQKISTEVKVDKTKVLSVIKEFSLAVKSDVKIAEAVATEQKLKPQEVKDVVAAQAPLLSEPEKNIEQTISIPQTVPIDEYEQVKKMWASQYEKGEVPVTENIRSRDSWVEKDIIAITNTLNKLFSGNQELKQEGLDEVGYILPVFMVNSLNGEQLVTYLKAKVEAAKSVKELFDKEKEITEKLKSKSETVEVFKPKKKEAEKTMELKEELKMKN
ncbi:hypothetical protein HZA76_02190 [Candidatus Roizmanbacteria bacterium]|nr:hypothetical protein [Candidatus Roizmanbacteria bacterium]